MGESDRQKLSETVGKKKEQREEREGQQEIKNESKPKCLRRLSGSLGATQERSQRRPASGYVTITVLLNTVCLFVSGVRVPGKINTGVTQHDAQPSRQFIPRTRRVSTLFPSVQNALTRTDITRLRRR